MGLWVICSGLPDLILESHLELLHLVVASLAIVIGALGLLTSLCVVLHTSVHEIELLDMHSILAQLCQVASIDLDAVRIGRVAFMELWVLTVRPRLTLLISCKNLLAGHEALRSACRATLLLAVGHTLQRGILSVSRGFRLCMILVGQIGRVPVVTRYLLSVLCLAASCLSSHELRLGLVLVACQTLRLLQLLALLGCRGGQLFVHRHRVAQRVEVLTRVLRGVLLAKPLPVVIEARIDEGI